MLKNADYLLVLTKTHFRSPVCDTLAVYFLKSLSVWRMCVSVGPTCHGTPQIRGQPQVLVCTAHLVGDSLSCSFVVMQASWSMNFWGFSVYPPFCHCDMGYCFLHGFYGFKLRSHTSVPSTLTHEPFLQCLLYTSKVQWLKKL